MDRQMQAHYAATLSHSFSMPSLAEGSEPISEAEEINEVSEINPSHSQQTTQMLFTVFGCIKTIIKFLMIM